MSRSTALPSTILAASLMAILLSSCGFQAKPDLEIGNPHPGYCPVMGEPVDLEKASAEPALQVEHDGRLYLMCCKGCKAKFDKDPAKWIREPVEPEL